MRSCPGPGDLGLAEQYRAERRGPNQAELDETSDSECEREVDEARDDWDRERGLLNDDNEEN
jgi:hypothetical protein